MPAWRLIDDARQPRRGWRNMAIDHALLESVQRGAPPVVRCYGWAPACLSFGRNQHASGIYDPARLRQAGVDVVRRPTGGLAVLHDRELTYAVIAPAGLLGGPRAAYTLINRALVAGLQALGVPAALSVGSTAPQPRDDTRLPCFRAPAPGEVVVGGRKLVGSAQRCEQRVLLQHGSILLDGVQDDVASFLLPDPAAAGAPPAGTGLPAAYGTGRGAAAPPAASAVATPRLAAPARGDVTLRELLPSAPAADVVAAAVAAGFEQIFGTRLALCRPSADEDSAAARLEAVYAGEAWTWRR